ncbi:PMT family glycosyltransferase, 4-amino-4-deoxy-L-arabinose transferase [Xenococcus sp. PCC 7305]|uniref:ArnT family glycosyltransferase n=1 Tax=Xenococcus sp. PCC 7305 TaxID=102125 RepID=UPI0002AD121C|nr:glycosyltransferase family 39 protein [Xenococcus sp. PCC 7305]ELS02499.1 PMT family glycosyltransferase, 4-amino-4-deoxy-L-arabinose transferase [Xenococcus sp. PCC 7305]
MFSFYNLRFKSDRLWLWGFFLAALFLYTHNLGGVPLRDWDEGIVATIAREIWRANSDSYAWLYPQNLDGTPYWNKPPLIHGLIALSYGYFGVSEWSTRLPTAIISSLAVPLLYCIGREIFEHRLEAIYATTVYLTLIPVARHGRLAMLDGAVVCFFSLVVWCLLKEGRWQRAEGRGIYLFGAGFGIGLICLTKGLALGILLGAIAFIFYYLVRPTNYRFKLCFWFFILLGLIPAIAWYVLQIIHYGRDFIEINLGIQTFNRVVNTVEDNSSPPWYYVLEIAKYTMPWLVFLPGAIQLAVHQRKEIWAKLALVWFSIYLVAISMMATKLPWYVMPIYPAFALLVGANLAQIHRKFRVGLIARTLLIIVAIIAWVGSIYYGWFDPGKDRDLLWVLGALALFMTIANILIKLGNRYFIGAIAIALYLALLLLFNSTHWNWELGESYGVKPVAEMIRRGTPEKQIIYTSYAYYRPSLNFYSDRIVIPLANQQLPENITTEGKSIFLLLAKNDPNFSDLKNSRVVGTTKEWQLVNVSSAK